MADFIKRKAMVQRSVVKVVNPFIEMEEIKEYFSKPKDWDKLKKEIMAEFGKASKPELISKEVKEMEIKVPFGVAVEMSVNPFNEPEPFEG